MPQRQQSCLKKIKQPPLFQSHKMLKLNLSYKTFLVLIYFTGYYATVQDSCKHLHSMEHHFWSNHLL
jgi:hypothetical protein